MTKGQVQDAQREALNQLDRWNDITGAIDKNSGWYYELQSVIEDAVHIGIQMSLYGAISKSDDNSINRI